MSTITTRNNNPTYTVGNVTWEPTAALALRQLPALFNDRWLDSLFDNIDKAFDVPNSHYPYDVKSYTNNEGEVYKYEIVTALAGVGKDNIKVKVKDGYLIIDVDTEKVEEKEHIRYVRKGISRRKATMSFHLAENVDAKNITSKYENGLLTVSVPVQLPEVTNIDVKVD